MTASGANLPAGKPLPSIDFSVLEKVVIQGDLSVLSPQERLFYYNKVCESVGLNPLTKPFDYLELDGKLVLYAKKDCTDQLRKIHNISITITGRERIGDVYCVTARATMPDGRCDESIGVVPLLKKEMVWDPQRFNPKTKTKGSYVWTGKYVPLTPDELANALMKSETKAKRRVTLSICGLGILDESEIETLEDARIVMEHELIHPGESALKQEAKIQEPRPTPKAEAAQKAPVRDPSRGQQSKPEPQNSSRTKDQSPGTAGKTIYRLVNMRTGESPNGNVYAQLIVQNVQTGQIETVIAKTPETINATADIRNDSLFELDLMVEDGFKFVKAIRVLDHVA